MTLVSSCAPTLQRDVRELAPVDGWRVIEPAGTGRAWCPCGTDTGTVVWADALSAHQWHTPVR
ncbi:hypothetical protein [Allonocardiopsis opalescens]|uniref:Uncharacterized protein n=1 Tax=Allonocardiopsis opalescens TaxID=1144618 RepID=A0A2T0PPU6_9ACTN|nr:hypothetical protein [Allonocardiopsis opalescens]PRX90838.1 hypothetical protein CLV72_11634 [Allonocardiopsis opalescens]